MLAFRDNSSKGDQLFTLRQACVQPKRNLYTYFTQPAWECYYCEEQTEELIKLFHTTCLEVLLLWGASGLLTDYQLLTFTFSLPNKRNSLCDRVAGRLSLSFPRRSRHLRNNFWVLVTDWLSEHCHPRLLSPSPLPEFLAIKHESRIGRHSSNPVCCFSMMEQVRICAVWPTENWLGSSSSVRPEMPCLPCCRPSE